MITLILVAASVLLLSCQSDQQRAAQVSIKPAGIIGDTTGPFAGRENIFGNIQDLAGGNDGHLYVLDERWKEIRQYSRDGQLLSSIMLSIGKGPGTIRFIGAFDVGSDGRFYLTSRRGRQVNILTAGGMPDGRFPVQITPTNIAVGSGDIYLTGFWPTTSGALVHRYSASGEEQAAFLENPAGWMEIAEAGNFERIAVTDRGTLIYSYPAPYRIVEVSPDGEILREAGGQPSFSGGPERNAEGFTRTDQRSSGLVILESGHVVNMIRDEAADTWYADIFTSDLKFIQRIERQAFGFERFQQVTTVGSTLYLSSPDPAPHVRRFEIAVE